MKVVGFMSSSVNLMIEKTITLKRRRKQTNKKEWHESGSLVAKIILE